MRNDTGDIMEPTYWRKSGWTARVIKNEDDDGWAVEIHKEGIAEPALISPWVMGRDKKNPKPFDAQAFATFVKTASEVLDRSATQRAGALKKSFSVEVGGQRVEVTLEQVPDEYEPHAVLMACDDAGQQLAQRRVEPSFKFSRSVAQTWAAEVCGSAD